MIDLLRGWLAPAYIAFDIVWLDSVALRSLPLHDRRVRLRGVLPKKERGHEHQPVPQRGDIGSGTCLARISKDYSPVGERGDA